MQDGAVIVHSRSPVESPFAAERHISLGRPPRHPAGVPTENGLRGDELHHASVPHERRPSSSPRSHAALPQFFTAQYGEDARTWFNHSVGVQTRRDELRSSLDREQMQGLPGAGGARSYMSLADRQAAEEHAARRSAVRADLQRQQSTLTAAALAAPRYVGGFDDLPSQAPHRAQAGSVRVASPSTPRSPAFSADGALVRASSLPIPIRRPD